MASVRSILGLGLLLAPLATAYPSSIKYATILESRQQVADSYDYVIVGGGTAALTVGDRLTEDSDATVLVIEHGILDNSSEILNGGATGGIDPSRMYSINSVPQVNLNNQQVAVLIGDLVGGSSGINGQVFHRGTAEEYDMWAQLGGEGSTWNWDGILPYFIRGIYFTPPSQQWADAMGASWDPDVWGQEQDTHIYATFAQSGSGMTVLMHDAMAAMPGVEVPQDQAGGDNGIAYFTTSMDPNDYTRSYARTGHWDGINRPNYHLVTSSRVNKILFDGTTATGVQYVPAEGGGQASTVTANKEVILAAGAIHTPQVLQLSGVGPSSLLQQANIPVVADLPGVGSNFQDHSYIPSITFEWGTQPSPPQVNIPPWNGGFHPNLAAFLGLPVVSPDNYEAIASEYEAQDAAQYLPDGADATVIAGYEAQKTALGAAMRSPDVTFYQQMIGGSPSGSVQNLRPVSRGTVLIDPSNPEAEPIVDYRAMSNPVDNAVMVEHIKFFRRYMTTGELAQYQARETSPGSGVSTDEQLGQWAREQTSPSVFHPCGTAAKMPQELGGVVNEDLLVHGVEHLSVVDASIFPTLVGGTISMTVYAVAEKAADLIKARA